MAGKNLLVFSWFHTDRLYEYMIKHNNKDNPKDLGFDVKDLLGEAARYFNWDVIMGKRQIRDWLQNWVSFTAWGRESMPAPKTQVEFEETLGGSDKGKTFWFKLKQNEPQQIKT